jgi:hypothetical protein
MSVVNIELKIRLVYLGHPDDLRDVQIGCHRFQAFANEILE